MDLQEKISRLEALLELDPNDYTGYFMLGKLHLDGGEPAKGVAAFERTIELKPDYTAAYRFCGDCHRRLEQIDMARDVYKRGIAVAERTGDLQTKKEMEAFLRKLEKS